MKYFDELLQEDVASYEGRHDDLIRQTPAFFRLLTRLLDDPILPRHIRPLVMAAIAYFILPADISSENPHGPHHYVDDIFLCAFVALRVAQEVNSEHILINNWDGETPVFPLVQEVIAREKDLIGEQLDRILRFLGYEFLLGKQLPAVNKSEASL